MSGTVLPAAVHGSEQAVQRVAGGGDARHQKDAPVLGNLPDAVRGHAVVLVSRAVVPHDQRVHPSARDELIRPHLEAPSLLLVVFARDDDHRLRHEHDHAVPVQVHEERAQRLRSQLPSEVFPTIGSLRPRLGAPAIRALSPDELFLPFRQGRAQVHGVKRDVVAKRRPNRRRDMEHLHEELDAHVRHTLFKRAHVPLEPRERAPGQPLASFALDPANVLRAEARVGIARPGP